MINLIKKIPLGTWGCLLAFHIGTLIFWDNTFFLFVYALGGLSSYFAGYYLFDKALNEFLDKLGIINDPDASLEKVGGQWDYLKKLKRGRK